MNYLNVGGSHVKRWRQKNQLLIVFLVVGFFMGIIYENLIAKNQGIFIRIFQLQNLEQYSQIKMISEEYLWYVFRVRAISFIIVCLLGMLKWKKILVSIFLIWTGFLGGVLMVSAVIQVGIRGILICIAGFMPHMFCYIFAYGMLLVYLYSYPRRQWNMAKTIFVILMLFVGMILETYVNPFFMKWIIAF